METWRYLRNLSTKTIKTECVKAFFLFIFEKKERKGLVDWKKVVPLQPQNEKTTKFFLMQRSFAEIAQLVEHNLAKVGVASSSLVFRSKCCPGGGMVDALVSGASAARRAGSSPVLGTENGEVAEW